MKPNSSCVLPTGGVGRALVLAGTPDIVRALRRCLPLSGYRIECVAHSGEEAIVSSRTTRLDLAVIDLNAPGGMDGATVCRHLRSEAGLPVVCVASERGTKEARCQEIGDPCAVLTKPLRKSDLRFAIGTAIYRAKLERKLKASESRHKLLTDNVSDVIMALDMERRFTYVSPSITPALGFTVEEFMAKRPEDFIVDARQSRHLSSTLIDLAKWGVPDPSTTATMAFRRKDGGIAWAEVKARLCLDQNHKPFEFIGVARDITERRLKEEALRLSEEKFYKAFHISPDSMTINRLADGVYLDVNDSFTRITGYSAADVLGRSSMVDDLSVWVHNEDRTRLAQALKESGEVVGFQAEFKRKDGKIIIGSMSAKLVRMNDEDCLLTVTRDLTELIRMQEDLKREVEQRKHVAEELAKREQMLQAVMNSIPDRIFWKDRDSVLQGCNLNYAIDAGVGLPELIVGKSDYDLSWKKEQSDGFRAMDKLVMESKQAILRYVELVHQANGKSAWVETTKVPMFDDEGEVVGILGTYHDITPQKEAEVKIRAALREKEVLLKEIHHRVRNNMQVVISLLSLQGSRVRDDYDREIFRDTQLRVRSMALIHDRLYQSGTLATIDLGRYLVELSIALRHVYDRNGVTIDVDANNLHVGIDAAIPCGLIVNELVSNALEHAFIGDRKGLVKVSLIRIDEETLSLEVRDNGIGVPDGFAFEGGKTFGLELVSILAQQLDANLMFSGKSGLSVTLVFPAKVFDGIETQANVGIA